MLDKIKLRAEKLKEMKAYANKAEMTKAEAKKYENLEKDFDKLTKDIEKAKKLDERAKRLEKYEAYMKEPVDTIIETDTKSYDNSADDKMFWNYVVEGRYDNSLVTDTASGGAYIVPQSFQKRVVEKAYELSRTRSLATVIRTTSITNIPVEGDAPVFNWAVEAGNLGTSAPSFKNKELKAHKLGTIIKVSRELLNDAMIDLPQYLSSKIAEGLDLAESNAFAIGDGNGKPTGYMNDVAVGDASTTEATDAVTAEELLGIFYDLKAEYRRNAVWRMTDRTEKAIRSLTNSNGDFIFDASLDNEDRPSLLGKPIVIDNNMPELGSGNKFIVIGDFKKFTIADRGHISVQRLNEYFAQTDEVGFKVTKRVDSIVVLDEAFNAGQNA